MANHPSAEKRNRQRIKRTTRNRTVTSSVRSVVKKVRAAITAKDGAAAKTALHEAITALDKAATKGVFHVKMVSRTVSRLSAQVHKLGAAPAPKAAAKTTKASAPKVAAAKKAKAEK